MEKLLDILESVSDMSERLRSNSADAPPNAIERALAWVNNHSEIQITGCADPAVERAARLSYAALQDISPMSELERMKLVRARLSAIETQDTLERLEIATAMMSEVRSMLAAKLAIEALA